ncbi:MAG: hypothetical protein JSW10_00735 [Pseudomonadota bacterium]|nr:MAG: hypothetical protein JSW10_00735 [Pseudomonadota bacterium]
MPYQKTLTVAALAVLVLGVGCTKSKEVSYERDVYPILEDHCVKCHSPGGQGYIKSGLDMKSYQGLMKGTKFGPVVTAGSSINSTLIRLIDHKANPEINMPHDQSKMPQDHIETVRAWIDAGAKNN